MERAKEILAKMASPSLFTQSNFEVGGTAGCVLAAVNLCDSMAILEMLKALKLSEIKKPDYKTLKTEIIPNFESRLSYSPEEQTAMLLGGDALLFLDGHDGCMILAVRKYTVRAVAEPPTSGIINGPREGFIEDIKTNLSLVERKLKTPDLKVDRLTIGRRTGTSVAVVSIKGIAKNDIVDKVLERLRTIDVDAILDTHILQEYMDERPSSIFAQSGLTEKPDVVASKLLEGRVAIFVDGSPMVMTLPYIFLEELQSGEDYYDRAPFTALLRIVRLVALVMGIILPGLYVALQEFHFDVLPLSLLLTIMQATQGVPFPPFGEVLFVLFLFEILREAGIRMPQALGLAMSVVGALVLGDTAVKAGFIGSTAVMIVALSSIALYTVPGTVGSSSLLRMGFTLIGGVAGLFGIMISGLFLIIYLCCLECYGAPYLAPFAPMIREDMQDSLMRPPMRELRTRPKSIPNENPRRQRDYGQD